MKPRNWLALILALLLGVLALSACSEEEPFPDGVNKEPYMDTIEALCDAVNKRNPELVKDFLYTCSEGVFNGKAIHAAIAEYTFVAEEYLPVQEVLETKKVPDKIEGARRSLYQFCKKDVSIEEMVQVTLKSSAPSAPKVTLMHIGEKWYVYALG